jgi:hypothetical protein
VRDESGKKEQHCKMKDKNRPGLRWVGERKRERHNKNESRKRHFPFLWFLSFPFFSSRHFYFSDPILYSHYSLLPSYNSNSVP